jgi:hypothetical protein
VDGRWRVTDALDARSPGSTVTAGAATTSSTSDNPSQSAATASFAFLMGTPLLPMRAHYTGVTRRRQRVTGTEGMAAAVG